MAIMTGLLELVMLGPVARDRDVASMMEIELHLTACKGKLIF